MANTKVTGDLIASSTIATGNIADNAVTSDKISGITTAHITEGSNLYYTDARADARVALVVDSAPSTLNTLNELADALGDDPNFATTTATSIGLKAPLASPSFTGIITANSSSSGDYIRIYGSSGTGKWDIYGNGANLRISDNESAGILAVDTGATFGGNVNVTGEAKVYTGSNFSYWGVDAGNSYVYLGTNTSGYGLSLQTGGTQRMLINSGGTVEIINSTSPKLRLTRGTKKYTSRVDNNNKFVIQEEGGNEFFVVESGAYSNSIRIDSSGNVGIGTASPSSNVSGSATMLEINDLANNNLASLALKAGTQGSKFEITASASNFLGFWDDNTERMRIDSSGLVSIKNVSNPTIQLTNTDTSLTSNQVIGSLDWYQSDPSGGGVGIINRISAINDSGFQGEASFSFQTGNTTDGLTEKMRITSGGNVGIGTTSPSSGRKLHIHNSATLTATYQKFSNGTATTGTTLGIDADGDFLINNGEAKEIKLYTSDTPRLIIQSGGNVGIGTTSPGAKFDVANYAQIDSYPANASGNNPSNSGYLKLIAGAKTGWGYGDELGKINFYGNDTSGIGARNAASIVAVCENGNGTSTTTFSSGLAFFTSSYNANQSEKVRIDNDGNVGIGTNDPGTYLQLGDYPSKNISQTSYPDVPSEHMIHIAAPETNGHFGGGISFGENAFTAANIVVRDAGAAGSLDLCFGTGDFNGMTERMRITSGGEIHIKNGTTTGGKILLSGTDNDLKIDGSRGQIQFSINGTNEAVLDALQFYPQANNGLNLGTTSLRFNTVYASNGVNTSDETLKENIKECDLGIDFIDSLKPKSYKFKDLKEDNDAYGKKRYGLIAQDLLQTELKDSIFGKKNGEYGLSYNDLIAPMIKAIQELKAEIDELKTQINN